MVLPADINFALRGGFVDRRNRIFPNYRRLSGCLVERLVNTTVALDQVDMGNPAISADDFALWVEPAGDNLITETLDLTKPVWEKGGNVAARANYASAPNSSYTASAIVWLSGSGNTQVLGRNFTLNQGSSHYLRLLLQCPVDSRFGNNDVIRFSGAIAGTPSYALANLNNYPGQYRFAEVPFTTTGVASVAVPATPLTITAVTANTLTLTLPGRSLNDLVGASIVCKSNLSTIYQVVSSTASSSGSVVVTVSSSTLITDGVTTSTTATLGQPTPQNVRIELYVESTASLIWGGGNLEQKSFPTSIIYQFDKRTGRSATECVFQPRDNPVTNATSFGLFADIKVWRGDGNLFNFGNWNLSISNGCLTATVGSVVFSDPDILPSSAKIFVQTAAENATTSIYVNGILKIKASTPSFRGSASSPLTLNSAGVRAYRSVWTVKVTQSDGQPTVGGLATGDVAVAFNSEVIGQDLIAAQDTVFVLQPVKVPANGQVFARFPFVPIDTETISAITGNVLSVNSALSFITGKAYIQTITGGTVTEVVVTGVNTTSTPNTISVSSASGISVGHTISQPFSETLIFPTNYFPSTVETMTGILAGVLGKAENGAIFSNSTSNDILITPKVTVAL